MTNFKSPAALSRFFLVMLLGLAADLWTKQLAFGTLAPEGIEKVTNPVSGRDQFQPVIAKTHPFIPGWVNFTVTCNQGAVFGLGQGQRAAFLVVSAGAILFLTYLFATSGRQPFYQVVLGLLLAGVLGNMYDRIQFSYVRDMIYALPGWKWPGTQREVFPWIFNVADSLLCIGVALVLILSLFQKKPAKQTESQPLAAH